MPPPKKVGSKPKRCDCVYKSAENAQRDLFRIRRSKGLSGWLIPIKNKPEQYGLCSDVCQVSQSYNIVPLHRDFNQIMR